MELIALFGLILLALLLVAVHRARANAPAVRLREFTAFNDATERAYSMRRHFTGGMR